MTEPTNFLDLDAVLDAAPRIVVKLKGVEHVLEQLTVEGWIKSTKAAQALEAAGDLTMEEEINSVIDMIIRAFPTMTKDGLFGLPLTALNRIVDFARQHNGQKVADAEAEDEAANPPVPAQPVTSDQSTSDSSSAA